MAPQTSFCSLKSPLTTRSEVRDACVSLLNPLLPSFSPGRARLRLGATAVRHDDTSADLEGFARPLWGLAALLAGGDTFPGVELWVQGLRNGTNPEHPEFWGYAQDLDQRMVEMCPLGFALCIAPRYFWDPLSATERENVRTWLAWINDKAMPNTNWLWFRVFANLALLKNGMPYSKERLEGDLDHLDGFHRGDGWSNDGPSGYIQMDYYSGSFAIQLLQLVYMKLNGDQDRERGKVYASRAKSYAKDFVRYFDAQGEHSSRKPESKCRVLFVDIILGRAITFGRSLVYRFAMAGFWSGLAFAEIELDPPFTWGVVKGLLLRNLRYWTQQRDILTNDGILNIGYNYPNQFMSENYNSPGSPYWFMLGFVCLALPESHVFWQTPELPYPRNDSPLAALKHPLHIMVDRGGHTFLLSSGQECHYPMRAAESKYGKFAYSSAFGYSVPTGAYTIGSIGGDSMLAVSDDQGETWRVRRRALNPRLKFDPTASTWVLVSQWNPWPDVSIETYLLAPTETTPNWHVRAHRISSKRQLSTSDAAFALDGVAAANGRELGVLDTHIPEGQLATAAEALAVSRSGAVGIAELSPQSRRGVVIAEDANSNLSVSRSVLPCLQMAIPAGSEVWVAAGVFAMPSTVSDFAQTWESAWTLRPQLPDWLSSSVCPDKTLSSSSTSAEKNPLIN